MLQPGAGTTPAAGAVLSSDMAAIGEERGGGGGEEAGGGISGGNRWPRQETLDLLKIRSDMDAVFRDSSLKGPLWEEISRKMAEKGYRRSAKKCREKFENVYKYHKRTKDSRAAKGPDKNYRFFDQLAALDGSSGQSSSSLVPPASAGSPPVESAVPIAMAMPPPRPPPQAPTAPQSQVMISTTQSEPFQLVMPVIQRIPTSAPVQRSGRRPSLSSSSTSSDEGVAAMRSRRKRKWKQFFDRLMEGVMEKQEELQRKFLEAIDKRESDRRIREEAWKAQEAARLKREHEMLVQERSMAAAKDAALVSFLQKLSDQQQIPLPPAILQYSSQSQPPPPPRPPPQKESGALVVMTPVPENYNVGEASASAGAGSSRWPKAEVEALIRLRTGMDQKYEEGGPKGPLWEEISAAMRREGYNRNPKRCKEKWENINKYYKKVKDSDRKRRDDSKTCPYYHQLDAIYRAKAQLPPPPPVAALPEQRWGPPQDPGSGNDDELYDDDDEEEEEEEENRAGG